MIRPLPLATAVVGVVAIGAAMILSTTRGGTHRSAPPITPIVDRGTLPAAFPVPPPAGATTVHHAVPPGSRLRYARLGVDAPVVPTTAHHGVMRIPRDPRTVGWWEGGAGAGDASGSTVVVGHVNYAGTAGALGVLPDARPGDRVELDEPGSRVILYRVLAVRTYPKTSGIPAEAFARTGAPRLVLITCGGPFDPATGNYLDNVVVYAAPG